MFLGFLLFLRSGGLKVTLHDWMSFIEGLHQGLHGQSFHGFYILCRTLLVKTESDLDKFDEMFHRYFEAVDPLAGDPGAYGAAGCCCKGVCRVFSEE